MCRSEKLSIPLDELVIIQYLKGRIYMIQNYSKWDCTQSELYHN